MTKSKRYWVIREYDSLDAIQEWRYPSGYWSDPEMTALLQRLASRHLSSSEIIHASFRRNHKDRSKLMEVRRSNKPPFTLSAGENPYFVATIESE